MPALEHLKAEYTEVWIPSQLVPLVQFADHVRSIASTQLDLVLDDAVPLSLHKTLDCFDEIVSWYGSNRPEFVQTLQRIHPRCTFLDALPSADWHGHAGDFFLAQAGAEKGIAPRIEIAATEPRDTVVIHPFSGSARKNWPLDRYRDFAARLQLSVEWMAGPDEVLDGAWRTDSLLDFARWMKGAAVYVGNDSGISHLAAAIGLPTITLFGSTDPAIWAPRGDKVRVLRRQPLSELAVETVLSAVTDYLLVRG